MRSVFCTILLLLGGLSACSSHPKEATTPSDAQALIDASKEKMSKIKSYDAVIDNNIDITISNQSAAVKMHMEYSHILDPYGIKGMIALDMDAGALGNMTQNVDIYIEEKDEQYQMYTKAQGTSDWLIEYLNNSEVTNYEPIELIHIFLEGISDAKIIRTEEIEGMKAQVVKGIIFGENLKELFKATSSASNFTDMNLEKISDVAFTKVFSNVPPLSIHIWIDTKSQYVIKYEMNMSEVMNQIIANVFEENVAKEWSYGNAQISTTCKNFNQIKPITMPKVK